MKSDARVIKGEVMKLQIFSTSLDIIAKEGLYGLSAKKIADQLNVSKSNIFHHFPSIELLKETLLDQTLAHLLTWDAAPVNPDTCLDDFFEHLIEQSLGISDADKVGYSALLQFHTACLHEPSYKSKFLIAKNLAVTSLANALSSYSKCSEKNRSEIANAIVMVLDGFGLHYLLEEDSESIKSVWNSMCIHWKQQLITGGQDD